MVSEWIIAIERYFHQPWIFGEKLFVKWDTDWVFLKWFALQANKKKQQIGQTFQHKKVGIASLSNLIVKLNGPVTYFPNTKQNKTLTDEWIRQWSLVIWMSLIQKANTCHQCHASFDQNISDGWYMYDTLRHSKFWHLISTCTRSCHFDELLRQSVMKISFKISFTLTKFPVYICRYLKGLIIIEA